MQTTNWRKVWPAFLLLTSLGGFLLTVLQSKDKNPWLLKALENYIGRVQWIAMYRWEMLRDF